MNMKTLLKERDELVRSRDAAKKAYVIAMFVLAILPFALVILMLNLLGCPTQ